MTLRKINMPTIIADLKQWQRHKPNTITGIIENSKTIVFAEGDYHVFIDRPISEYPDGPDGPGYYLIHTRIGYIRFRKEDWKA